MTRSLRSPRGAEEKGDGHSSAGSVNAIRALYRPVAHGLQGHAVAEGRVHGADGQSEVDQLDPEGRGAVVDQHDVVRLEVRVDHPDTLEGIKSCQKLNIDQTV